MKNSYSYFGDRLTGYYVAFNGAHLGRVAIALTDDKTWIAYDRKGKVRGGFHSRHKAADLLLESHLAMMRNTQSAH